MPIPRSAGHVGSRKLLIPSIPDVNDPIPESISVSDQEMEAQPFVPEALMDAIEGIGITGGLAGMVDYDTAPALSIQRGLGLEDGIDHRSIAQHANIRGGQESVTRSVLFLKRE